MGARVPNLIAQEIKEARLAQGLGQAPLGRLVGLRQGQVSALERSEPVRLTIKVVQKIREILGIDIPGFDGHSEEAQTSLFLLPAERSIQVVSTLVEDRLIERLWENPSELRAIDHRLFEELVAELWSGFGYSVELTKRTRDGGKDIIAISDRSNVSAKYLIECKRPGEGKPVGVAPVRELYGVKVSDGATKAILATTSYFSPDAHQFLGKHRWELEGKDYDGILDWIERYVREYLEG